MKKTKIRAKDIREQKKIELRQKWQSNKNNIDNVEDLQKTTNVVVDNEKIDKDIPSKKKYDKTIAKSLGLKSTLVFNEKVVLTSLYQDKKSKGNKEIKVPHIEKVTNYSGDNISIDNERSFKSEVKETEIHLEKSKSEQIITNEEENTHCYFANPTMVKLHDYISLKEKLENNFFGESFVNDNLHIQIAYNILDVKKILSAYVNNIIYIFYNLNRDVFSDSKGGWDEYNDLINKIYTYSSLDEYRNYVDSKNSVQENLKLKNIETLLVRVEKYRVYFNNVFLTYLDFLPNNVSKSDKCKKYSKDELSKAYEEAKKENYNILRLLSFIRNVCVHSVVDVVAKKDRVQSEIALYNLDKYFGENGNGLMLTLNNIYKRAVDRINSDFVKNSGNNIFILKTLYPNKSEIELIKCYYDFVVYKDSNNLGINLKLLRDSMLETYSDFADIISDDCNTYRGKLYTIINFVLFNAIKQSEELEEFIKTLRSVRCSVNEKEEVRKSIYKKYSAIYYKKTKDLILKAYEITKGQVAKENNKDNANRGFDKVELKLETLNANVDCFTVDNTNSFVKIIYLLSEFLDGKEINELLCSFINKFDNISDLIETANSCDYSVDFSKDYKMFEHSREISESLRIVKNIGRMKTETYSKDKVIITDALKMLNSTYIYDDIMDNKQKINFIKNTVIKSKWFTYIAKYSNPNTCNKIMSNEKILKFVLGKEDFPMKQIEKYYVRVTGGCKSNGDKNKMTNKLINQLKRFSIDDMLDGVGENNKDIKYKEQCKSIVNLYLTVAYIAMKSIIKTNNRFAIAFSCLERDYYLLNGTEIKNYIALTNDYLEKETNKYDEFHKEKDKLKTLAEEGKEKFYKDLNDNYKNAFHYKGHDFKYLKENLQEINKLCPNNKDLYNYFRNNVCHLTFVAKACEYLDDIGDSKSFYGVYCNVIQKMIVQEESFKCLADYMYNKQDKGYNQDFMWLLNLPFAYNLARYKNLSIEDLFYRDK